MDAEIGTAPANVAAHRIVDVLVRRLGVGFEQANRRHDLSGLAVAALGHAQFNPGALHRTAYGVGFLVLNRRYLLALQRRDGRDARACGLAVDMDSAGTAQSHAAAKLGAGHTQLIAQHPEQRRVVSSFYGLLFSVDRECWHSGSGGVVLWGYRRGMR